MGSNYSFLNLEFVTNSNSCHNISIFYLLNWIFPRKPFKGRNYTRKYGAYFLLNLIFFCNFIPKLKCCRVSFKSQKCASLSCAQWDIWLTFKYLSTPLHHAQRKVTFIPKRNPCDYEKTRRRNLKIKQLFMYVLINILIIQTRGCHCLIHK